MSSSEPASGAAESSAAQRNRENVQVAVRVRPATVDEKCGVNYKNMIKVVDGSLLVFDPDCDGQGIRSRGEARRRVGSRRARNMRYAYDHVFGEECGQQLIFERTTLPLIDYVTRGFAATVFAYGATGSGKVCIRCLIVARVKCTRPPHTRPRSPSPRRPTRCSAALPVVLE